jgi:hypothetical protein
MSHVSVQKILTPSIHRHHYVQKQVQLQSLLSSNRLYSDILIYCHQHRLCGLVITVPGYRSRGRGFNSRRYQIFRVVVGLERGPLSLVGTTAT